MIRILFVDDDRVIRTAFEAYFEDDEFEIYCVKSAEEGLCQLELLSIDLCVVDMRLPGIDGNQFICEISKRYPSMKFLIFTASTNYRLPKLLRDVGLTERDIMLKPIDDMIALEEKIRAKFT